MKILAAVLMSLTVAIGAAGCSNLEAQTPGQQKAQKQQAKNKNKANSSKKESDEKKQNSSPQVKVMLTKLTVAEEVSSEYSRDDFEHWSDLDGDGCDSRDEVLSRENREPTGADCDSESGMWYSAYDGETTTDPSSFDVDHMVPLSEAWDSGADKWNDERREQYANDLHPYSLIAVSATSNRSKSDQDPAEWMPELDSFTCQYVARWIAVKFRWRLAVDPEEKSSLSEYMNDCSNKDLKLQSSVPMSSKPAPEKKDTSKSKKSSKGSKKQNGDPIFSSCSAAKSKGFGPYKKGDKEYGSYTDGDGDGVVCE